MQDIAEVAMMRFNHPRAASTTASSGYNSGGGRWGQR